MEHNITLSQKKTFTYDVTHGNIPPQVFSLIKDQTGAPYTTKERNHKKDRKLS